MAKTRTTEKLLIPALIGLVGAIIIIVANWDIVKSIPDVFKYLKYLKSFKIIALVVVEILAIISLPIYFILYLIFMKKPKHNIILTIFGVFYFISNLIIRILSLTQYKDLSYIFKYLPWYIVVFYILYVMYYLISTLYVIYLDYDKFIPIQSKVFLFLSLLLVVFYLFVATKAGTSFKNVCLTILPILLIIPYFYNYQDSAYEYSNSNAEPRPMITPNVGFKNDVNPQMAYNNMMNPRVQQPVEQPVYQPIQQPVEQPVYQPAPQPIQQPMVQPQQAVPEMTSQPVVQPPAPQVEVPANLDAVNVIPPALDVIPNIIHDSENQ